MTELSWQRRLAIVLSAIWLALAGAISADEHNALMVFLMLGVLPVAFCWGVAWVWSGFRKQRTPTAAPPLDQQAAESVARATLFRWLAAIFLAGGIGVFYYAFANTGVEPAGQIGYLVGFYFWVPILAYVLWSGTFKKKKGVGALIFSVAFLGIAIYQAHGMLREEEETKQLLSKAQTMMLKLMNGELVERAELSNVGQYSSVLLVTHDFLSQAFGDFKAK